MQLCPLCRNGTSPTTEGAVMSFAVMSYAVMSFASLWYFSHYQRSCEIYRYFLCVAMVHLPLLKELRNMQLCPLCSNGTSSTTKGTAIYAVSVGISCQIAE